MSLNTCRNHLKKVFSSDIGVESSSQFLDILMYACGLILGFALISNENPNFEMISKGDLPYDVIDPRPDTGQCANRFLKTYNLQPATRNP